MGKKQLLKICKYMSESDIEKIDIAHQFAEEYHKHQTRKSKEPYITHLENVAIILAKLNQQATTIQAGLLHDILEDTNCTKTEIKTEFGEEILELVEGVTKLERIHYPSNVEQQAENYRKLFFAMTKDIRVVIIKLADRLHNMRTLHFLNIPKQKRIAKETLDVYAPLAHRLGIAQIKWELEDLAFATLHRDDFNHIKELISDKREQREAIIESMCIKIKDLLSKNQIEAEVNGRPKHFFSIYKKLYDEKIEFSQLFDLYGVRIITNTIANCYQILGYLHASYKPIEGRLKDYIALPKSNMYQSLHTTVIGPNGHRIEVQIRTTEMHHISEFGIAAHWSYKEKTKKESLDFSWLNQILTEKNDSADNFIENLKINLYDDEVFIFTPKGDIITLPKGATILDAAFKIHTDVGLQFKAGIVNGQIVPINYILKNGDQIEIQNRKNAQPNLGWLDIVTTRFSKSKIKNYFKKQDTELRIKMGETKLKKYLIKYGFIKNKKVSIAQFLDRIKENSNYNKHNDILIAITNNEISESNVVKCCKDETPAEPLKDLKIKKSKTIRQSMVCIDGETDIETHIAKCCQPLPGDQIIGYITRGYGIAIHNRNCKMLNSQKELNNHRITAASWVIESQDVYSTEVQLSVIDRPYLLKDILDQISKLNLNISKATTKLYKNGNAKIFLICDFKTNDDFFILKNQLLKFEDIIDIVRKVDHSK